MTPRLFALLFTLAATPTLAQVTLLDQWVAVPATPSGGPNSDTNLGSPFAAEDFVRRFDFRPAAIIERLSLLRPIYRETTNYGHFGRPGLPWEA